MQPLADANIQVGGPICDTLSHGCISGNCRLAGIGLRGDLAFFKI